MATPWLDVTTFAPIGTPRDGQQDWRRFIQNAIDAIIERPLADPKSIGTLYLPTGMYLISGPLLIRKRGTGTYLPCSIEIVGDAAGA